MAHVPYLRAAAVCLAIWALVPLAHAAISLPAGFSQSTVVSGLNKPVGMAFLPDDRILIIEQDSGKVKVWAGGAASNPGTATVAVLITSGNERG